MIVLHFYFLCLIKPGLLTAFTFIRNSLHLARVTFSWYIRWSSPFRPLEGGCSSCLHFTWETFLQRLWSGRTPWAPPHPISCTCRRWKDVCRKCPVINLMSIRAELFFSPHYPLVSGDKRHEVTGAASGALSSPSLFVDICCVYRFALAPSSIKAFGDWRVLIINACFAFCARFELPTCWED